MYMYMYMYVLVLVPDCPQSQKFWRNSHLPFSSFPASSPCLYPALWPLETSSRYWNESCDLLLDLANPSVKKQTINVKLSSLTFHNTQPTPSRVFDIHGGQSPWISRSKLPPLPPTLKLCRFCYIQCTSIHFTGVFREIDRLEFELITKMCT